VRSLPATQEELHELITSAIKAGIGVGLHMAELVNRESGPDVANELPV